MTTIAMHEMLDTIPNPYGLPHATLRPHQAETIDWLLGLRASAAVVNAPTGSGKTSFAAAMASKKRTAALVKTKSLQSENYGGSYEFDVLYGRGNYDCVHPDASTYATAAECLFTGGMYDCPHAGECGYLQAKGRAAYSFRASLNYAYWLAASWPAQRLAESGGYLFLDEAHQLSDIVLDHTSVTVTMRERLEWDLPSFPIVRGRATEAEITACVDWLRAAERVLRKTARELAPQGVDGDEDERGPDDPKAVQLPEAVMKRLRKCRSLLAKIMAVRHALQTDANDWYLRCGPAARATVAGREPAFVARPLTARYHFPRYFLASDWKTVMMSATIGDPATFAAELGLETYVYRDIPNAWPAETRPVLDLGAPAMGYATRNDEAVQSDQARRIAAAILSCPADWKGIIHTTSKAQAVALAQRISEQGVPAWRLWTPNPSHGTEKMLTEWKRQKRLTQGAIAVTWAWHEGYDGTEEKICISAKTPFPSLGDDYERERMHYSGAMFLQRTAWSLEQQLGRTRRGRDEDYDRDGRRAGLVAIADGNWRRVQKYLSPSLRDAIVAADF